MYVIKDAPILQPSDLSLGQYDVKQFGTMLQNIVDFDKVVSISWSRDDENNVGPTFSIFKDVNEVLNMMRSNYSTPFVLGQGTDSYTKENAILEFSDHNMEIFVITWKNNGRVFRFFSPDVYQNLKRALSQNAIPWSTYSQSQ